MSIVSEALQDQELAAALFRQRSPFRAIADDYNEYSRSMFDRAALAMVADRFRRSFRDDESKIRDFIQEHTGHFTTDPTPEGARQLVERLRADGIVPMFIVQPNPDAPKLFVLMRKEPKLGERYQPGDIIASLELPRP